jgi:hypothetical protein
MMIKPDNRYVGALILDIPDSKTLKNILVTSQEPQFIPTYLNIEYLHSEGFIQ